MQVDPIAASHLKRKMFVTRTAQMEVGDEVVLVGKFSGLSRCKISALEPRVNWPELGCPTTEYAIVGRDGSHFTKPGDSGSFVLSKGGNVVSLLMGEPRGPGYGGVSYVTLIKDVFADIEEQTG